MASARPKQLFSGALGLCNTKDSVRQAFDPKTGLSQLPQAVNVDIDATGRPSRCSGFTSKRAEASMSGWSDGENCLFIAGASLYKLHPDYSRTLIRSGLTVGAQMSYVAVGDRVYYSNGYENGYVIDTANNAWVAGTSGAPTSNVTFSDPPAGHLITLAFGRMLVALDNVIVASEPSFYGRFNLAKYRMEKDRITMLWPVLGGLFVGTESSVSFYRGEKWEEVRREVKISSGALEGSAAHCQPELLDMELDSPAVIFSTSKGICLGGAGGMFRNLTENDLLLPNARRASGAIVKDRYVVNIAP